MYDMYIVVSAGAVRLHAVKESAHVRERQGKFRTACRTRGPASQDLKITQRKRMCRSKIDLSCAF